MKIKRSDKWSSKWSSDRERSKWLAKTAQPLPGAFQQIARAEGDEEYVVRKFLGVIRQSQATIKSRLQEASDQDLIEIANCKELEEAVKTQDTEKVTHSWEEAVSKTPAVLEILAEVPISRDSVQLLLELLREELTARVLQKAKGQTKGQVSMISTFRTDPQKEVIAI